MTSKKRAGGAMPPALWSSSSWDPRSVPRDHGSMSGNVAVSVLGPEVIVSVTSVKVTLTSTGVI